MSARVSKLCIRKKNRIRKFDKYLHVFCKKIFRSINIYRNGATSDCVKKKKDNELEIRGFVVSFRKKKL